MSISHLSCAQQTQIMGISCYQYACLGGLFLLYSIYMAQYPNVILLMQRYKLSTKHASKKSFIFPHPAIF